MFNKFNRNMNSKLDTNIYLLIIAVLALIICYLKHELVLPAVLIMGITYYFARRNVINKEVFLSGYLDNIIRNIERTNHYAVRKLDVGIAVFNKEGKLQWKNDLFSQYVGKQNLEGMLPEEILPLGDKKFDILVLRDGEMNIQIDGRYYLLKHASVKTQDHPQGDDNESNSSGLMIYLTDVTDYELLRQKYYNDKLCLAYARFDNYEEVARGMKDTKLTALSSEISELLTQWVAEQGGFICRMNKEICLMGFTQSAVLNMMDEKFTILDKIREIRSGNKIAPTYSIGLSCDGVTLPELLQSANNCLSNALNRGGDQAVVLKDKKTLFYGGTSAVGAKNTRVRARIVAQTIREQMMAAEKIFVMGHHSEDYDAIGAVVGVAKMAKSLDKETYIVASVDDEYYRRIGDVLSSENIILSENETLYMDIMVREEEALELVTPKSLLVIVDHHRLALSASQKLVEAIKNRIIIDHHRRAEDIIENTTLLYLEPSSSSTCELVTELIPYFDDTMELTPAEATALYAGIVLDTKNFAVQTGERTFEAAALLTRSGADPKLVRLMFKDDMGSVQMKARLISDAKMPIPGMAITVMRNAERETRSSVLAAQTADSLVTINGVAVGIAMVEYKDGGLGISARSDGTVNVQVIMEELGGGGHQTVAGAQLKNTRAKEVEAQLVAAAKKQLEPPEQEEEKE